MIRLIGVFMIFSACCAAGMIISASIRKKLERLNLFRRMSDEISTFIRYNSLTVREIFMKLQENKAYSSLAFINAYDYGFKGRAAAAIWLEGIDSDPELTADEKHILSQLGTQLGTTDTQGQLSVISIFNEELEAMIKKQSERYAVKGKLYRSIGVLAGAMLGILII